MNTSERIDAIISAFVLDESVTGVPVFNLSELKINQPIDTPLPSKLRLGHLAERAVARCIQTSNNYELVHQNVQLIEDKKTIGELDFIIEEKSTRKQIHIEVAYKFYLLDPTISSEEIKNWIGPNRNDSLYKKLEKLKNKQFPLLHHPILQKTLPGLDTERISQSLCFMVSLYLPYKYTSSINKTYTDAVKGVYMNYETFLSLQNDDKLYSLPPRRTWGINPSKHQEWLMVKEILPKMKEILAGNQSVLVWKKEGDFYSEIFVVWW